MGMRFRKSINLGGGARLNVSKSGVGISIGVGGVRKSVSTSGVTRTSVSVPGTGVSYVKQSGGGKKPPFFRRGGIMWLCLILLAPLGIVLLWRNKKDWPSWLKIAISAVFGLFWAGCLLFGGTSASDPAPEAPALTVQEPAPERAAPSVQTERPASAAASGESYGNFTVVGSQKSDKYHTPSCRYAKDIAPENLLTWDSCEAAEKAGYAPCGTCKPR